MTIASQRLANGFSRRNFLVRTSKMLALLVGVEFLNIVTNRMASSNATAAPCKLQTGANLCTQTGIGCGLTGPAICGGNTASYPNCIQPNGCPAGTTLSTGSWSACCVCPNVSTQGQEVTYNDCCGTVNNTLCPNWGPLAGCAGQGAISCPSCAFSDWCPANIVHTYICSIMTVGGICTPGS